MTIPLDHETSLNETSPWPDKDQHLGAITSHATRNKKKQKAPWTRNTQKAHCEMKDVEGSY